MGREKLSLQGIPYDRQDFGMLSEVQQSDLAGNAMSEYCSFILVCATPFSLNRGIVVAAADPMPV